MTTVVTSTTSLLHQGHFSLHIDHMKTDYWMKRSFLEGTRGDAFNMLMAAAYNMLVFFRLLVEDAGRTPRECVIWE